MIIVKVFRMVFLYFNLILLVFRIIVNIFELEYDMRVLLRFFVCIMNLIVRFEEEKLYMFLVWVLVFLKCSV